MSIASEEPFTQVPDAGTVARGISGHRRESAYDQAVVGYLIQLTAELEGQGGPEAELTRQRVSRLVRELDDATLARLVEFSGSVEHRRRFVLDANQSLTAESVLKVLRVAASSSGQNVSHSMTRLLTKLAAHAEDGTDRVRTQAGAALRENVEALMADWALEDPEPRFTFMRGEIVFQNQPLRQLREWEWGPRLAAVGAQRLEFPQRVSQEEFEAFLDELVARLVGTPVRSAEVRQGRPSNILYGEVGLSGDTEPASREMETLTSYSLGEELDAVGWMQGELRGGRSLPMMEAEGVVRSLSVAMHGDQAFLIPLVRLKDFDQYTVTHTLNVAVLTMALAEFVGLGPREVRGFGIAGLLHDLGKVTIPNDILNKPGKLTDDERAVMNDHTVQGARLILQAEQDLDLAAVVAYEHHIRIDGGGYPTLRYRRACHQASNLVHVCDVFDALRTRRPYRDAWPTERALSLIAEGAGTEFDAEVAEAFIGMMRQWEGRVSEVSMEEPLVRPGVTTNNARSSDEGIRPS